MKEHEILLTILGNREKTVFVSEELLNRLLDVNAEVTVDFTASLYRPEMIPSHDDLPNKWHIKIKPIGEIRIK